MRLCVQLCKATGWGLGDALGLPLDELEEWCGAVKDVLRDRYELSHATLMCAAMVANFCSSPTSVRPCCPPAAKSAAISA